MRLNKFCRTAIVSEGMIICNSITENCVVVDEITAKIIEILSEKQMDSVEINSFYHHLNKDISDTDINYQIDNLIMEGFVDE